MFTLDDWLKSDNDPEWLASEWVQNYAYNTLSLQDLKNRSQYWYDYFTKSGNNWKWRYGKTSTYYLN